MELTNYVVAQVAVGFLGLVIVVLCIAMKREDRGRADIAMNFTVALFGACVGWLLGILLSPYNAAERTMFAQYASAVSAFVSGYVLSKVDKTLTHVLTPEALSRPLVGFRIMIFASAILLGIVFTATVRAYGSGPR